MMIAMMVSFASFAQNKDVTRFLGIPVDGTVSSVKQKLKAKGFKQSPFLITNLKVDLMVTILMLVLSRIMGKFGVFLLGTRFLQTKQIFAYALIICVSNF